MRTIIRTTKIKDIHVKVQLILRNKSQGGKRDFSDKEISRKIHPKKYLFFSRLLVLFINILTFVCVFESRRSPLN